MFRFLVSRVANVGTCFWISESWRTSRLVLRKVRPPRATSW